ncbi:MAG TPA: NUDIX domain-containing protein [Aliidongia sp.]|nr:NUDIX domain-containing protein [Aliidongia sp.]
MPADAPALRKRAARPRDAATLILTRGTGAEAALLMGRRHEGHRFMPGMWVFPGGRIDRADAYIRPMSPLRPEVAERLAIGCSARRAEALALAGIRETFEETGLRVGRPVPGRTPRAPSPTWAAFMAAGVAPALDMLDYIARAITPPYRPIRFHARFFMADASHALGEAKPSDELVELRWVPIGEARALELPRITAIVLDEIAARLGSPAARPAPFYSMRHGKSVVAYD